MKEVGINRYLHYLYLLFVSYALFWIAMTTWGVLNCCFKRNIPSEQQNLEKQSLVTYNFLIQSVNEINLINAYHHLVSEATHLLFKSHDATFNHCVPANSLNRKTLTCKTNKDGVFFFSYTYITDLTVNWLGKNWIFIAFCVQQCEVVFLLIL